MLLAAANKDSELELVEVADDEGDGHGLAERPPEAEHDAADDAGLGVGQHEPPDDFPGGGAERVGGLLQHRRGDFEDVAHDGGDEGDDHDGEDDAGRQQPDADGGPAKSSPRTGTFLNTTAAAAGRTATGWG
jgi:hypothetical protein